MVVVAAVHRIVTNVIEHVVHPAHVPLEVEAQPAHRWRPADRRPGGRFLGVGGGAGAFRAEHFVHPAQEMHGFEIFTAPVDVGNPLAVLAAVVSVEHRGDGIHAQTVNAVLLDPVQRVADEVVEHLAPPEVVDQRAPVLVHPLARVGVLVEALPVEAGESVLVGREVGGNPVDDDVEAGAVAGGDELAEPVRRAETCRRRIEAERLVAPGSVEGMLGNRQEFEVRETEVDGVGDQCFRQAVPVEETAILVAPPGAEVNFVDGDRRIELAAGADGPALFLPRQAVDDRGGGRAQFGGKSVRVGFVGQNAAVPGANLVLVAGPGFQARDEQFPDAAFTAQAHRVAAAVPGVEVADDADALRIRRPDGEGDALDAVDLAQMRAELDACLLNDEEMAQGVEGWRQLADPFGPWYEQVA